MAAFGLAVILHAATFPEMGGMEYGPAFFPSLIGGAFVIVGVAMVFSGAVTPRTVRGPLLARPEWTRQRIAVLRAMGVVLAVVAFALLSPVAGFLATTIVISAGLLALMGADWRVTVPLSLVLPVALYYAFSTILRVPLPRGVLERMFF